MTDWDGGQELLTALVGPLKSADELDMKAIPGF